MNELAEQLPPMIGPAYTEVQEEIDDRVREVLEEPIVIDDTEQLPPSDVEIDFEPPPIARYIRAGVMGDKTLDKNTKLIRKAIGQVGYNNAMKNHNLRHLAGYDLFTPDGLRDALFDPTRYIPQHVIDITSDRVRKVAENKKKIMKVGKLPERQRDQAYKSSAREKYRNDIRAVIRQNNPQISYEDQEAEVERTYNILSGREYII